MKDLHVVITGGASGIGAHTCALLAERGARLTVLDIRPPEHSAWRYVPYDQANPASIAAAAAAVDGPIHALLNIAGVPPRAGQAASVLRINFLGVRQLTHALLPQMVQGGSIVNLSSRAGARWREHLPQVQALLALDDGASPQAVAGFVAAHSIDDTRAYDLSKEVLTVWSLLQCEPLLARGLRINSVAPSAVATGILQDFLTAFGERATRMIARVGRPAQPQEVAEVAAFLASPASSWLNGMELPVDGGMGALLVRDSLAFDANGVAAARQ